MRETGEGAGRRDWEASRVKLNSRKGSVVQVGQVWACYRLWDRRLEGKNAQSPGEENKLFFSACYELSTQW